DLDDREACELAQVWPQIDAPRRAWVLRELIDLAEDNVEMNFDKVYFQGLGDDNADVRRDSVRGLWEYERPDLIPRLVALVESDDSIAVRAEAALSLGRFVVARANGRLRERHFEAIEQSIRRVLARSDESVDVLARALESIGAHDVAWVRQSISEAYESGDRRLKTSAVHAMGRSCERRWLPLILREMTNDEPELRYEAAIAAGSIGDEAAVCQLVELTGDEDVEVAQASILALGQIGGAEAKRALQEIAESDSPALSEAASAAMAEIQFAEDPLSFRRK
ncbi:MAG: HEAT repeat domain-containing protein, partial [Dehalococcoidia bacterium]